MCFSSSQAFEEIAVFSILNAFKNVFQSFGFSNSIFKISFFLCTKFVHYFNSG